MEIWDNNLIRNTFDILQKRLPPGWRVELDSGPEAPSRFRFATKDERSREIPVMTLSRPSPRVALELPGERPLLVAARYLSPGVRELLDEMGVGYVDQSGNVRVVLGSPGLFISSTGAESNPWPEARRFTLRGVKAGRLVCALICSHLPVGVRELAALAATDPGYVSRLLSMLDESAIVERSSRGQVLQVEWQKLLLRWSEDAPLSSRTRASSWLAPRGLSHVWERLRYAELPYLLTGSAVAEKLAPVAPTRLASIYVKNAEDMGAALELIPADAGANVVLLEPEDASLLSGGREMDGLRMAGLPLVVADLLTGPGRSPAEAEALMDWMASNQEAWRG